MTTRAGWTAALAAGAAALALAGCGDSDDETTTGAGEDTGKTSAKDDGKGKSDGKGGKGGSGSLEPPKGPIQEGEVTLKPTRKCKKVGFSQGAQFVRGKQAPNPYVRARVEGDQIVVTYRFLAVPGDCKPVSLSVTGNSIEKPEAFTRPPKTGESGLVKARRSGTIRMPLPKGGSEPYQVQISSLTKKDIASDTSTVPVE